jgi:3-dehydroquinate synthase class II
MKFTAVCLGSFLFFVALPCLGQPQDGGSASSTAAKPSTPPANGQANASTAKTTVPPEKKKPKKVWTNDEIGSVKGQISVVGDAHADSGGTGDRSRTVSTNSNQPRQMQIENYRNQIQQYQAQIDAADKRIAQLKSFKGQNTDPSAGININQGYNMVPLEDQVKQLEDKKKQLKAKIEDVENDARKNGVESGDLR